MRPLVSGASSSRDGQQSRVALSMRSDNCALRFAFALPAGKHTLDRGLVRHEAIDASRLANPTARSFELNRSGHLGGTRMHKSRETGTGSFGTRHCQAQFVPPDGRSPTSRRKRVPEPISMLICSLIGLRHRRLKFAPVEAALPGLTPAMQRSTACALRRGAGAPSRMLERWLAARLKHACCHGSTRDLLSSA
jgi:hypothetical protein